LWGLLFEREAESVEIFITQDSASGIVPVLKYHAGREMSQHEV